MNRAPNEFDGDFAKIHPKHTGKPHFRQNLRRIGSTSSIRACQAGQACGLAGTTVPVEFGPQTCRTRPKVSSSAADGQSRTAPPPHHTTAAPHHCHTAAGTT
ncbi:hypothetical protein, partial [Cryobacterium sp. M96]|uniref:hypothetical protein n=1 Tax=Cryobacterium sp. M96 TaxID=2048295 RepID=UPI001E2AAA35